VTTRGGRRPAEADPNRSAQEAAGQPELAPVPAATRAGEDARRRGWFWHWNSLVTQYAPLIGLKGVGLLNSYTVWTDRREESPHRGYAFPSQQSEADFYGEDRAELIAINKILVALDLIEIRKEMVLRTDPQGRRWKVPHNFYRVKDHDDGFVLSAREVLKVAALAEGDKAVYRYVRRVFSPRFAPIDADNPWHRILPEVRQTPLWQGLAAKAAAEEGRASARTKAGHAARRGTGESAGTGEAEPAGAAFFVPEGGDTTAAGRVDSDTRPVATHQVEGTVVGGANSGSAPVVDRANRGSSPSGPTVVGGRNRDQAPVVDRTNTTYHQNVSTTTTGRIEDEIAGLAGRAAESTGDERAPGLRQSEPTPPASATGSGGPGEAPADAAGEAAAVRAFQEANDRPATPAERKLLAGLAERFGPAATADGASGWTWVAAAAYEAVEAGSAFVAPRRLREIMGRWEREGYPHEEGGPRPNGGQSPTIAPPSRSSPAARGGRSERGGPTSRVTPAPVEGSARLAGSPTAERVWSRTLELLAGAIDRAALADLADGGAIAGERDGVVTVAVADGARAERLTVGYSGLVGRKLSTVLRRPVRVRFAAPDWQPEPDPDPDPAPRPGRSGLARPAAEPEPVPFLVAECGLASGAVWSAMLDELAAVGIARSEVDAWLRPGALLGRGGDGGAGSALVVGLPHELARRRVAGRYLTALRAAAAALGLPAEIELAVTGDWLAGAGAGANEDVLGGQTA
jgi:hypothetical protein